MRDAVFGSIFASSKRQRLDDSTPDWVRSVKNGEGKPLGSGTFGKVVSINDGKTCVKRFDKLDHVLGVEFFAREARFVTVKPHRYILRIDECYRAPNSSVGYLRMECATQDACAFFEQKTLEARLPHAKTFHAHVTLGLEHLHTELNLVHLDIKLDNVLWFEDAKVFKLADFGFTIPKNSPKDELRWAGTKGYNIPDYLLEPMIARDHKDIGILRDEWALAVCMHVILVNCFPVWDKNGDTGWTSFLIEIQKERLDYEVINHVLFLPGFGSGEEKLRDKYDALYKKYIVQAFQESWVQIQPPVESLRVT
jgi:serine/threonine protein kinase